MTTGNFDTFSQETLQAQEATGDFLQEKSQAEVKMQKIEQELTESLKQKTQKERYVDQNAQKIRNIDITIASNQKKIASLKNSTLQTHKELQIQTEVFQNQEAQLRTWNAKNASLEHRRKNASNEQDLNQIEKMYTYNLSQIEAFKKMIATSQKFIQFAKNKLQSEEKSQKQLYLTNQKLQQEKSKIQKRNELYASAIKKVDVIIKTLYEQKKNIEQNQNNNKEKTEDFLTETKQKMDIVNSENIDREAKKLLSQIIEFPEDNQVLIDDLQKYIDEKIANENFSNDQQKEDRIDALFVEWSRMRAREFMEKSDGIMSIENLRKSLQDSDEGQVTLNDWNNDVNDGETQNLSDKSQIVSENAIPQNDDTKEDIPLNPLYRKDMQTVMPQNPENTWIQNDFDENLYDGGIIGVSFSMKGMSQDLKDILKKKVDSETETPEMAKNRQEESRKLMNFAHTELWNFVNESSLSEMGAKTLLQKDGFEALDTFLRGEKSPDAAFSAVMSINRTIVLEQFLYAMEQNPKLQDRQGTIWYLVKNSILSYFSDIDRDAIMKNPTSPENLEKLIAAIAKFYPLDWNAEEANQDDSNELSVGSLDGILLKKEAWVLSNLIIHTNGNNTENGYEKLRRVEGIIFAVMARDYRETESGEGKLDNDYEKAPIKNKNSKNSVFASDTHYNDAVKNMRVSQSGFDVYNRLRSTKVESIFQKNPIQNTSKNLLNRSGSQKSSGMFRNIHIASNRIGVQNFSETQKILDSGKKIPLNIATNPNNESTMQAFLKYDNPNDKNIQIEINGRNFSIPDSIKTEWEIQAYVNMIEKMLQNPLFEYIFKTDESRSALFFQKLFTKKYPTEKIAARPYKFYEIILEQIALASGIEDMKNLKNEDDINKFLRKMQNPEYFNPIKNTLMQKNIIDETGVITESSILRAKNKNSNTES